MNYTDEEKLEMLEFSDDKMIELAVSSPELFAFAAMVQREAEPEREEGETLMNWSRRVLGYDQEVPFIHSGFVFFGQQSAKEQIEPFVDRNETFPNTLILGQPGIGKTRLARWIAARRGSLFEELLCPVNPDDLPPSGIVLLDECHKQRHPEYLFPMMEKQEITILGATTRPEVLEPAFKSRFLLVLHLKRYEEEAMIDMANDLLEMSEESAELYASASAGNPRQLERILAVAKELGPSAHEAVLRACRITGDGLTEYHLDVLRALHKAGRPIGLSTLASMIYSDEQSVKDHEQLLVEVDLIELRSNGRILSRMGKKYISDRMEQNA
jgi:Holliday junction resolvasome RuvABC ATP-dependent DNA helicase subunit